MLGYTVGIERLPFKSFKQHSQVIGAFNKDFVHTGIFPKEISKKINKAQEVRHASDYDDFYMIQIEEVMSFGKLYGSLHCNRVRKFPNWQTSPTVQY